MGYYVLNLESEKLEMHFDREEYMALDNDQKKEIKRHFLFSKYRSAWVSRSKNNLHWPQQVAEKLGLENRGEEGERISFEEKMDRKQDRASRRADRFEGYKENSKKRQEIYQREWLSYRGDIAFHTQPNINSSAGRAFTNYRNRVRARYEKGFEEMNKQDYFEGRIAAAERTAEAPELQDVAFLQRRIDERESRIRKLKRSIAEIEDKLKAGKHLKYINGQYQEVEYTDDQKEHLANLAFKEFDRIDIIIDELSFYKMKLEEAGGHAFTKQSMKEAKATHLRFRHGTYPIKSLNQKTVTVLNWMDIAHWDYKVPYGEIKEIFTLTDGKTVLDRDDKEVKPLIKF